MHPELWTGWPGRWAVHIGWSLSVAQGQTLWNPKNWSRNAKRNMSRMPKYACKCCKNAEITVCCKQRHNFRNSQRIMFTYAQHLQVFFIWKMWTAFFEFSPYSCYANNGIMQYCGICWILMMLKIVMQDIHRLPEMKNTILPLRLSNIIENFKQIVFIGKRNQVHVYYFPFQHLSKQLSSLTHSLIHSLTYSLTHSLTHSRVAIVWKSVR